MLDERWAPVAAEGLAPPRVAAGATGGGVLVAIIDTGVNLSHPHVASPPTAREVVRPRGGAAVEREDGALVLVPGAHADRHGHGTCCAALLRLLAPGAELYVLRVTGAQGTTDADRLARGVEAAAEAGAALALVALGARTLLPHALDQAVVRALELGTVVVAADPGYPVHPAASPGAIPVRHQDGVDVMWEGDGLLAEGRARPAPGHPSNFWGASLAVARAGAALARFAEQSGLRGADLTRGFKRALVWV